MESSNSQNSLKSRLSIDTSGCFGTQRFHRGEALLDRPGQPEVAVPRRVLQVGYDDNFFHDVFNGTKPRTRV